MRRPAGSRNRGLRPIPERRPRVGFTRSPTRPGGTPFLRLLHEPGPGLTSATVLRSPRMDEPLAYVSLGDDGMRAAMIAAVCRSEGLHVHLLDGDDTGLGPVLAGLQGHRLLVREADRSAVEAIVAGFD